MRKTSTQNVEAPTVDHSVYVRKTGARMTGRINMGDKKITSLAEPTENSDAVTKGYADRFHQYLNDRKVSKSGDTMTGSLDMSGEKITRVGDPTDNKDAATKEYVDNKDAVTKEYVDALIQHEHEVSLHSVGRYIVLPNKKDGTKKYFSLRAKKNVDLDSGKLVEVKNGETFNARPTQIGVVSESEELPNPDKDLKIMQYNTSNLEIYFNPPNSIPQPWNISFSAMIPNTASTLTFPVNPVTQKRIVFAWNVDGHTFTIYTIHGEVEYTASVPDLSQKDFVHISIEYVSRKFRVWINGEQRISYTTNLVYLQGIELSVPKLGILSFYNRNLGKSEIVQHFIDHHVKNFTNDEVFILFYFISFFFNLGDPFNALALFFLGAQVAQGHT